MMNGIILWSIMIVAATPTAAAQDSPKTLRPDLVIQQTSNELLAAVDGRRAYLAKNPEELHAIIRAVFLPRFDIKYAARLILPRTWTSVTDAQRQQFGAALFGSLVRRYAIGALQHNETRVRVVPFRWKLAKPGEEQFATVNTIVTMDNGTRVPVNYEMRSTEHRWKIYDVKIEGRSYVLYYRRTFGPQIKEKGIDAVIQELNDNQKR